MIIMVVVDEGPPPSVPRLNNMPACIGHFHILDESNEIQNEPHNFIMPKNKGKGGKNRRRGKNDNEGK